MKRTNSRYQKRGRSTRTGYQDQALLDVLKRIDDNTLQARPHPAPSTRDKIPVQLSNKTVYTFKRSTTGPTVSVSTSSSLFGASAYYLASFDSTSEFAEQFQEYRILEITVHFIPVQNDVHDPGIGGSTANNWGNFETAIDYRNATVPISHAELQQYKSYQVVKTGEPVSRTFTPRTLGRCYGGVTDAFYCMPAFTWLSTDYNDAEYYGIKWATGQTSGTGSVAVYSTRIDAVIQCRNTL